MKVGNGPEGVIYVTCETSNLVDAVDATSHQVIAQIATAPRPRGIAFTHDGATSFITDENGAALTVVDAINERSIGTIAMPHTAGQQVPPRRMGIVFAPNDKTLFVSLGRAKQVARIDPVARRVMHVIDDVGARPWGMGLAEAQ